MLCFICTIKVTSEAKIQPVFTGREDMPVAFDYSHQGHALVALYVQFLCSDWSRFDCILKLVYFDSWSWQRFVSTCDVFNCLFPLSVQSEIQPLLRVFCYCYSQLVCLLGFWMRNTSLVKVGNPISEWHRFRFLPCLMRKRVEKSEERKKSRKSDLGMASFSFFTLLDA